MTDTDQEREDEVLRRMLATKPKPHVAGKLGRDKPAPSRSRDDRKNEQG